MALFRPSDIAIGRRAGLVAAATAVWLGAGDAVLAQPVISASPFEQAANADPDARMLLQADELVYDYDSEQASAVGSVEIYYQGYSVEAARVVYDQRSQRVYATGGVKITEPDGNVIYADTVELSDDFREGFLTELTLVTPENARFAAAAAERRDDNLTIFTRGVYTACEPCRENPDRAPIWQFKAARIIHDQEEKVVRYEDATFEFFGVPVGYLPFFSHADPTVKRKSGFLRPDVHYASNVGYGVGVPYFFALAPHYDLTAQLSAFSEQGVLADVEWRHRLVNGNYSVRGAFIDQSDPDAFDAFQSQRDQRGFLAARGFFNINEFWNWGFEGHLLSDSKFFDDYFFTSERDLRDTVFLTGMSATNYFDARIVNFQVLQDYNPAYDNPNKELPVVHPVVDYNYIHDTPVLGGQLSLDSNFLSISREEPDFAYATNWRECPIYGLETGDLQPGAGNPRLDSDLATPQNCTLLGTPGTFTRLVAETEWERTIVTGAGQLITPFAALRGDVYALDIEDPYLDTVGVPVMDRFIDTDNDTIVRGMATAGVEGRWPILVSAGWGYQIFEPTAQLIARPDAQDNYAVPNEDALAFVFDDTNLFERDKFSGYDLMEGGSRLNAGLRYKLRTNSGFAVSALFGQSYHLTGDNPFALGTGLGTDTSDYVGSLYVSPTESIELGTRIRLDEDDFDLMRQDFQVRGKAGAVTGQAIYSDIAADPLTGVDYDRSEVQGKATLDLTESWNVFGGARYELEGPNDDQWVSQSLGVGYSDECVAFALSYERSFIRDGNIEPDERITFSLTLKTVTQAQVSTSLSSFDDL